MNTSSIIFYAFSSFTSDSFILGEKSGSDPSSLILTFVKGDIYLYNICEVFLKKISRKSEIHRLYYRKIQIFMKCWKHISKYISIRERGKTRKEEKVNENGKVRH